MAEGDRNVSRNDGTDELLNAARSGRRDAERRRGTTQATEAELAKAVESVKLETRAAEERLGRLEQELADAEIARKKLSERQRAMLDKVARATVTSGGELGIDYGDLVKNRGQASTFQSLQRRGLLTSGTRGSVLSQAGRGLDQEGIQGDIINQSRYVERMRESLGEATKAIEQRAASQVPGRGSKKNVLDGDLDEFERKAKEIAQEADRRAAEVDRYRRDAAAGKVPGIGSPSFQAAAEEERKAAETVQRLIANPPATGTDIIRHPTAFGQRVKGPFRFTDETSSAGGTPRGALDVDYGRAQAELSAANRRRKQVKDNADKFTLQERIDAENQHKAAVERFEAVRFHRATIVGAAQAEAQAAAAYGAAMKALAAETAAAAAQARGRRNLPAVIPQGGALTAPPPPPAAQRLLGPGAGPLDRYRPGAIGPARFFPNYIDSTAEEIPFDEEDLNAARARRRAERDERARRRAQPSAGGGGGGLPPGPPDLRTAMGDEDFGRYQRAMASAGQATGHFDEGLQRLARNQAIAGDQMRRHGLLTTDFLSAMAQGRVTVREMGVQIGGTIAKFGGWTAAASLTYGMLAAVQALGSGAIESQQGVTSLQRLITNIDTSKAQRDFRNLSAQFNLPIDQVVSASFEAAKAFRTQTDAMEATQAALYAVKIGELDAADAAKFVTAAHRGFGVEAGKLINVIDVVNQLQNRFGADFKGTAQGIAAAAGSFGAAGGKVNELASFLATGSITTGKSGAEIATALRRTAEIVKRPERRQTILDVLGIDPKTSTITEVLERAQQAVADGADVGEVARAITTPELASRAIIPILRSQALYHQVSAEAARAHGSAERELATVLESVREQLGRVTNGLQRFGSAAAEGGALSGFKLILATLNATIGAAQKLVSVFTLLPSGIRESVVVSGQLLGALALMRRFDVGGRGAEGGLFQRTLGRNPARRLRAEILQGLQDERTEYIIPERRRATTQAIRANRSAARADDVFQDLARAPQPHTEAQARAVTLADDRRRSLARAAEEADAIAEDLRLEHEANQAAQRDFRSATTRRAGVSGPGAEARVRGEADRLGILYASPIEPRPGSEQAIPLGGSTAAGAKRAAQQVADQETRGARTTFRSAFATAVQARAGTSGAGTNIGGVASARAAATAARATGASAIKGIVTATAGLGTALLASLGPIDAALLGIVALFGAMSAYKDHIKGVQDRLEKLRQANLASDLDDAKKEVEKQGKQTIGDRFTGILDAIARSASAPALGIGPASPLPATKEQRQQLERQRQEELNRRLQGLEPAEVGLTGKDIRKRYDARVAAGDPQADELAIESARHYRGLIVAEFNLRNAQRDHASKETIDKLKLAVTKAHESINTFIEKIRNDTIAREAVQGEYDRNLTLEQLGAANALRIRRVGPDGKLVRGSANVLRERYRDAMQISDPEERAKALEELDQARADIEKSLSDELDKELARLTGNPRAGRALRAHYIEQIRRLRAGPLQQLLKRQRQTTQDLQDETDELDRLQDEIRGTSDFKPSDAAINKAFYERGKSLRGVQSGRGGAYEILGKSGEAARIYGGKNASELPADIADFLPGGSPTDDSQLLRGGSQATLAKDRARRRDLRNRIRQSKGREKDIRQELRRTNKEINDLQREQDRAQFEQETSYGELVTNVRAARLPAGRQRIAYEIQRAGRVVQRAIRLFGRDSREALQAIITAQELQDQAAQAELDHIDAVAELRASRESTDSGQGAQRLRGLRQRLAAQRANPRTNPDDILRTRAQINEAVRAQSEQVEQDANALLDAQFNYRASLTDDPVKQAQLQVDKANALLRRGGLTQAERLNALADRNNARREKENALRSRQTDEIDLQVEIGNFTREEGLAAYERIYRGMKKGTEAYREMRARILRMRHELETGSDGFELDVGSIRLPSPYEVHRAIKEGRRAQRESKGVAVNQSNSITLNLAPGDDGSALINTLENYTNTSIKSVMRASGEIGA